MGLRIDTRQIKAKPRRQQLKGIHLCPQERGHYIILVECNNGVGATCAYYYGSLNNNPRFVDPHAVATCSKSTQAVPRRQYHAGSSRAYLTDLLLEQLQIII